MTEEEANIALDVIVKNFLSVNSVLVDDLNELLDKREETDSWKRRIIRETCAYVEAVCNSFRELGIIADNLYGPEEMRKNFSSNELDSIRRDRMGAADRIKGNIRVGHKCANSAKSKTDFGSEGWEWTQKLISKRDSLMHPKSPACIAITDAEWEGIEAAIKWIIDEVFAPYRGMNEALKAESKK